MGLLVGSLACGSDGMSGAASVASFEVSCGDGTTVPLSGLKQVR